MPVKVTDPAILAQLNGSSQGSAQMPQIGAPIMTVPGADIKTTEAATAAAKAPSDIAASKADAALKAAQAQKTTEDAADEAKKDKLRIASKLLDTDNVLTAIKDAKENTGDWTTGLTGRLFAHIGSIGGIKNEAYNLQQELGTIAGNIAFDKYTTLKENMPQGAQGGLRLTDNELALLTKLQGSIAQEQDPQTLKTNLDRIDQRYRMDAALSSGLDPSDPQVMQTFGIKAAPKMPGTTNTKHPADIDAIMKKYGAK